jgi:hypothetical protein
MAEGNPGMKNRSPQYPLTTITTVRRTVLAALATAAILLGTIAMHASMTTEAASSIPAAATHTAPHSQTVGAEVARESATRIEVTGTEVAETEATTAHALSAVAVVVSYVALPGDAPHLAAFVAPHGDHCAGMCAGHCTLLEAACMLGVSAAVVGLGLFLRPPIFGYTRVAVMRSARISARRVMSPRAPSLTVLSICRT